MYRVEDKYQCSEGEMRLLQMRLEPLLRPDDFQTNINGYKVTSVYFDDLNDSFLKDTVNGIRLREKYRIRIYDNSFETIKLEVKYKRDNRVLKKTRSITKEQMQSLVDGECIEDKENSLGSPVTLFNLGIKTYGLRPKVIVEYDRKAYVYNAGNVRITLDRDIRAGDQIETFIRGGTVQYNYIDEISRVLEVKYDEFLPGFIADILESGNMKQISCSKYRLCRERSVL